MHVRLEQVRGKHHFLKKIRHFVFHSQHSQYAGLTATLWIKAQTSLGKFKNLLQREREKGRARERESTFKLLTNILEFQILESVGNSGILSTIALMLQVRIPTRNFAISASKTLSSSRFLLG